MLQSKAGIENRDYKAQRQRGSSGVAAV